MTGTHMPFFVLNGYKSFAGMTHGTCQKSLFGNADSTIGLTTSLRYSW
jgi:hypothetical protein